MKTLLIEDIEMRLGNKLALTPLQDYCLDVSLNLSLTAFPQLPQICESSEKDKAFAYLFESWASAIRFHLKLRPLVAGLRYEPPRLFLPFDEHQKSEEEASISELEQRCKYPKVLKPVRF